MSANNWTTWKASECKKVNIPVNWLSAEKQTSCNERESGGESEMKYNSYSHTQMSANNWKEWKAFKYNKGNIPVPCVSTANQTICNDRESGAHSELKKTVSPTTFVKSNYQQVKRYPYRKTKKRKNISKKHCYKFNGNQCSMVKNTYKWVNPKLQKIKNESTKEREERGNTVSNVSSSGGLSSVN